MASLLKLSQVKTWSSVMSRWRILEQSHHMLYMYVYWAMPLHFCLRSDARLSLTKSIQRELYHLLPLKSFHKLAKVCLGKDSKQESRPDQRQQRPYFQLVMWGRIQDQLRFFRGHTTPFRRGGNSWGGASQRFPNASNFGQFRGFIYRPRQSCQRSPAANPSGHPVERPSHLPPGMMLHLNPKSFSRKSPPLSRTPETLHFKLGFYKQRPLGQSGRTTKSFWGLFRKKWCTSLPTCPSGWQVLPESSRNLWNL